MNLLKAFYPTVTDNASVELDERRSLVVQHQAGAVRIAALRDGETASLLLSAEAAYELTRLLNYAVHQRVIPRCL